MKEEIPYHQIRPYKDLSRGEVYDALRSEVDFMPGHAELDKPIIGMSFYKTYLAYRLEKFANVVERGDHPGYIRKGNDRRGRPVLEVSPLATFFSEVLHCGLVDNERHQFSEEAELVISCVRSMGLQHEKLKSPLDKDSAGERYGFELFNEIVERVRESLKDEDFVHRRRRRKERARRHYLSGCKHIDQLFKRYARLVVLRIDLGYRDGLEGRNHLVSKKSLVQARCDLKKFQNNMRSNQLFEHVVGLIWKLEYGMTKGYHFHLIVFCDGSKVHKDAYIAQKICEYWERSITKGQGIGYNCNRYKKGYKHCGIGMVAHDDEPMRENLLGALAYLAKEDQCLRVRTDGERTFGHWVAKERTTTSGRPRKNGAGLPTPHDAPVE